jgi:hypothetical protein
MPVPGTPSARTVAVRSSLEVNNMNALYRAIAGFKKGDTKHQQVYNMSFSLAHSVYMTSEIFTEVKIWILIL